MQVQNAGRKRIFRPRNRTGISSKASLAEGDVSICGDRARSYVADLRQTRLVHLHGNIIIPRLSRTDTLNLPCQTCGFHAADEKPGRRGVFYRFNLTNGCCKFVQRFCRAHRGSISKLARCAVYLDKFYNRIFRRF